MKHIYMLFAVLAISSTALAQLPSGSIAPDFTATDINGEEWNLYDLLDEGNTVILDFSATWCGPCWNYALGGTLEDMYSTFGPEGTGDLYVFYLESDDSTTDADLNGTGTATTGDWVSITNFPIIDNASNIFDSYSNTYYPTIYTVCPDGTPNATTGEMEYSLVESGQATFEGHVAAAFMDCSNSITGAAPLMTYNGETSSCGGGEWMASTSVSNLGSDDVTAMIFAVELNGVAQSDVTWAGVLSNGGNETVDLGSYNEIGTFDYTLMSVNGADWNAEGSAAIVGSTEATSYVQVRITTDNWPEETGWMITDANGTYVDGVATGDLAGQNDTELSWDVALDLNECYVFTMTDSYGDGLYASQWGDYVDGVASIVSMDGMDVVGIVLDYNGASGLEFAELVAGMEVTSVTGITENDLTSSVNVFPNPFSDNTTLSFSAAEAGQATVVVYNLIGEKVIEMNLGNIAAGTQSLQLNFSSLEAGIYLVNLNAGNETSTLRVTNVQ
ncbi:T9SS type A sorting domain-containing protein [Algibacter sp.]|nr:T9SS type A sorting domain-containing protein [Algibacter sp.]